MHTVTCHRSGSLPRAAGSCKPHPARCTALNRLAGSHALPHKQQRCGVLHEQPCRHQHVCGAGSDGEASTVGDSDWVEDNADALRALPLAAGGLGVGSVLLNRLIFGIAPVVDASSSQSRTDVLVIIMSAALLLTGLSWLSLKPKPVTSVDLEGSEVSYVDPTLPAAAAEEVRWAWEALQGTTRARALVLFWRDACVCHQGMGAPGLVPGSAAAAPGPICQRAQSSGKGTYFANLAPYPGRVEFTGYLPENTQGLIVQPVGELGVVVVATDAQRAFSRLDQAWVAALADKLETSLEEWAPPGSGFLAPPAKPAKRA